LWIMLVWSRSTTVVLATAGTPDIVVVSKLLRMTVVTSIEWISRCAQAEGLGRSDWSAKVDMVLRRWQRAQADQVFLHYLWQVRKERQRLLVLTCSLWGAY